MTNENLAAFWEKVEVEDQRPAITITGTRYTLAASFSVVAQVSVTLSSFRLDKARDRLSDNEERRGSISVGCRKSDLVVVSFFRVLSPPPSPTPKVLRDTYRNGSASSTSAPAAADLWEREKGCVIR